MSSRNRNILPNNLAQLQNLIKRDPESYQEEFLQQWKHFQSNLEVFKLDPTIEAEAVDEVMKFIAQVRLTVYFILSKTNLVHTVLGSHRPLSIL